MTGGGGNLFSPFISLCYVFISGDSVTLWCGLTPDVCCLGDGSYLNVTYP